MAMDGDSQTNVTQKESNSSKSNKKLLREIPPDIDWVQLQKDMNEGIGPEESGRSRMIRKFTGSPLVPFGCLMTVSALSYGLWNFYKGNSLWSNYMMRSRVFAQGFTIAVAVGAVVGAAKLTDAPSPPAIPQSSKSV